MCHIRKYPIEFTHDEEYKNYIYFVTNYLQTHFYNIALLRSHGIVCDVELLW